MALLHVWNRFYALIPLVSTLLCSISLARHGYTNTIHLGQLDISRTILAALAAAVRLAAIQWHGRVEDIINLGTVVAVLTAAAIAFAEARRGLHETTALRRHRSLLHNRAEPSQLIGASACYDTVLWPSHEWRWWCYIAWSVLACSAALAYVGFNAGARRAKPPRMSMSVGLLMTPTDYQRLEEPDEDDIPETPEDAAGPLSTICFTWMSPLLSIGYNSQLESDDLYALARSDQPELLAKQLRSQIDQRITRGVAPDKALLGALFAAFGPYYLVGCFFKICYDTAQLATPLLLSAFLDSLDHGGSNDPAKQRRRYTLSAAMVLIAIFSTAVLHQYFHRVYRTGMRLKSAATSLVFEKALVAKNLDTTSAEKRKKKLDKKRRAAKEAQGGDERKSDDADDDDESTDKRKSTSIVANLMSVDAQRLQDNMTYLFTIVSGIYQIAACLYLLYVQLGYSSFAGFAVMVIFLPITQRVILMSRRFQQRVLVHKDARIKLQTEALGGMKIIKLYGWEHPLAEELKRLRRKELTALWSYKLVSVLSRVVYSVVPTAVSLCTFAMYVLLGNKLSVSRVYTSLALFNILRFPLMMVPRAIGSAVEAMLSVERIGNYLASQEVTPLEPLVGTTTQHQVGKSAGGRARVFAQHADVDWPQAPSEVQTATETSSRATPECIPPSDELEERTLLRDINFDLEPGTLTVVVGETGSGKSGLLLSLLGETSVAAGSLGVTGSIAYAAQTAWIRNATLKENVLFGSRMDVDRYNETIRRCALVQDLKEFANGDATEIGEKGLTLSGGQKQRVALARALYADADVYLLDDVLSAVDAHVAVHLFDQLICHLRDIGKVVLLVTHNLSTIRRCDRVICIGSTSRRIEYSGPPEGFVQLGLGDPLGNRLAAKAAAKVNSNNDLASLAAIETSSVDGSQVASNTESLGATADGQREGSGARLINDEERQKGGVSGVAKRAYIAATGGLLAVSIVIGAQLAYQIASVVASWWLGYWSAKPHLGTALGLEVYSGLSIMAVALSCVAFGLMSYIGQRAAHKMHDDLLDGLLLAPMKFFDSTPLGRLVNLFSKDLYTIDEELPVTLAMWMTVGTIVLMTLITIAFATPWFLAACAPLGVVYYGIMVYFIPTVRELKRLDATSRSPVFSSFAEALDGTTTIRAFRAESRFTTEVTERLRSNLRAYFLGTAANRWLAVRLETLGTFIAGASAFLAVCASVRS